MAYAGLEELSTMSLVATILAITIFTYFLYTFFFGRARNPPLPPGPSPWPIIGCLPQMLREPNKYKWIKRVMAEFNTEICCIRIGNVHVVPVIGQKIASEVLKEKDLIFASRPESLAARLISHNYKGAVNAPIGPQWTKTRKMMAAELLSPAIHKYFLKKRTEEVDNIVTYIHNQPDGIVDMRKTTLCYTTNIIKRLMFNTRYFGEATPDKGPGPAEEEHYDAVMTALAYLFAFAISDFFPLLSGLDFDGKEKKAVDAFKTIEKYQNPIIEKRIQKWRGGSVSSKVASQPEDMLDIMINLKDSDGKHSLSEDEIKAQINELVLGATDNAANSIEWSIAQMLNKPSIMQKAMEEIDSVVGKDRLVQESDIPELKYIKAILMEAFRLHTTQPFIPPHLASKDATLGGYFIPKGSHILVSRRDLGLNPNAWEEPLTFNPDRFIKSGAANRSIITDPDLGFLSFGVGRRACAATTLGTSMTVVALARLLQAFDWSLPPGTDKVDLRACDNYLNLLFTPLAARATPRLAPHLYQF